MDPLQLVSTTQMTIYNPLHWSTKEQLPFAPPPSELLLSAAIPPGCIQERCDTVKLRCWFTWDLPQLEGTQQPWNNLCPPSPASSLSFSATEENPHLTDG